MDIVEAARSYMGVEFRHQGRNKLGLDCLGLLLVSAKDCGIVLEDLKGYPRTPDGVTLKAECERQLKPVRKQDMKAGDVLLMSFRHEPQHVAIKTDIGLIHSYMNSGGVVEHGLDDSWNKRIKGVYRLWQL